MPNTETREDREELLNDLANRFTYHQPTAEQPEVYAAVRDAGHLLALLVAMAAPFSRERALAITKAEEAVMWANAAIARHGLGEAAQTGAAPATVMAALALAEANPHTLFAGWMNRHVEPDADVDARFVVQHWERVGDFDGAWVTQCDPMPVGRALYTLTRRIGTGDASGWRLHPVCEQLTVAHTTVLHDDGDEVRAHVENLDLDLFAVIRWAIDTYGLAGVQRAVGRVPMAPPVIKAQRISERREAVHREAGEVRDEDARPTLLASVLDALDQLDGLDQIAEGIRRAMDR